MRCFELYRHEDESGVSGTGIVALGVQFPSGRCVMEWQRPGASIGFYHSIDILMDIHGHGGLTVVRWRSCEQPR